MEVKMKNIPIISLLPTILLCNNISAIELSKHLSTTTEPAPKVRVNPKYPVNAARSNREGWAQFSFVIEKDGSVSNVINIANSGSKDITLAAKKAVMKWQYEPAMENGEPIQQCVNYVQLDFEMHGSRTTGVTRKFSNLYKKAKLALDEKKYDEVEELLTRFKKIKNMHATENNFLQLLKAQYAKDMGNDEQQLNELYDVKFKHDKKNNQQRFAVLNEKLHLEIKLNRLKQAYTTYQEIMQLPDAEPHKVYYEKLVNRIDDFIASEEALVINGNIKNKDYWFYSLVRNEFSLTNIDGRLTKMDIRCANKRHVYTVENNNTWQIPKSWQNCSIFIYGEDNTKFNLVEHPFKV